MRPYRLFFSHGGDDTGIVESFFKPQLESSGAVVFVDAGSIEYGDDFRKCILSELARCHELLVFLTQAAVRRPWVMAEVGAVLVRKKRIIALTYGPDESKLQKLGILSLLGTTRLLQIEKFDRYVIQVQRRVEAHNHG
jgi:hypothetical protein